jgi:O-antigen ligase/polysaccharide polymerase Wzy-like membrane protein
MNSLSTQAPSAFRPRRTHLALALAVASGAAVSLHMIATVTAFATVSVGLVLARVGVDRAFLVTLGVLLAGYAFADRGFAHVGVAPIYLGELVLGLGVVAAVRARTWLVAGASAFPVALIAIFMAWGVLGTLPNIPVYGVDALRDAVLWGYATFTFLIFVLLRPHQLERVPDWYSSMIPLFLVWVPAVTLASYAIEMPTLPGGSPGGSVEIVSLKFSDVGVHLAGIGAFLLLGLHRTSIIRQPVLRAATLPLYLGSLALVAIASRGGSLAAACAIPALALTRPSRGWLVGALGATVLIGTFAIGDPLAGVEFGEGQRSLSVTQLGQNLSSIIGNPSPSALEGTETARLEWWRAIVNYTIFGTYFWTGKGFGVNLGIDDGMLTSPDDPARDPHNSHMTVLARMGVPGLAIWVAFLVAFAIVISRAFLDARRAGDHHRAGLFGWVLLYWLAMLVNTSFDPYLESPMGGVWFWCLVGYGLALISQQDQPARVVSQGQKA